MDSVYDRNCPSIYRGIVESNIDPENIGRCKIRVPSIHGELNFPAEALPWARPIATSPVGKGKGNVNIPDIGDIVWVLFEGGVREFPVYFGGTYAKEDLSMSNDKVDFYVEGNSKISYDRSNRVVSVSVGNSKVLISGNRVEVRGGLSVSGNLYADEVDIEGRLSVTGNLSAQNTNVGGRLSVVGKLSANDISASGGVSVSENLSVNGTVSAEEISVRDKLNASSLNVSGTATIANLIITGSCNREWRR